MGLIRRMDEHLATLIAAGEVVAGPVSVVRELVDNALDAGATGVDVEIEGGGLRLVRVADDGRGMDAEDARLCFERHATSKLAAPRDLDAITTLGFRGEALAAIAAVSRVRLETRRREDAAGTRVRAVGADVVEAGATARRPGTTFEVADLFWNTPARRAYLDTPAVEGRRVLQAVTRIALARPDVRFALRSDGDELLELPPAADLLARVRRIHGREFAAALLPLAAEREGVRVRGHVTRPGDAVRQPRRSAFAVNGRPVESPELRRVLADTLAGVGPHGRHPEAVVHLEIPAGDVDVNVTPDKSQVRFRRPKQVWAAVTDAVRHAYGEREAVAGFPRPVLVTTVVGPRTTAAPAHPAPAPVEPPPLELPVSTGRVTAPQAPTPQVPAPQAPTAQAPASRAPAPPAVREAPAGYAARRHGIPENPAAVLQAAGTFLVCTVPEGLLVIDQHSAHERVLYEQLRRRYEAAPGAAETQMLLIPEVLRVDAEQAALLEEMGPYLARLGFEVAPAGPRELWIHAVPAALRDRAPAAALERLVEAYLAVRATGVRAGEAAEGITPAEDRLLKTLACHAAVKAGQPLAESEVRALWRDLVHVDLACHDVHGRPAALLLPAADLARRMGRTLPTD